MSASIDISKKPGKGRPKKREDNSCRFEVRLSQSEKEMLEHMEIESSKSRAEHVRRALMMYYNAGYWRK